MKKKNAIMIADTRPALIGHLLLQIKETNSHLFDEAIIYYENITKKDQKIMSEIMPCKFIEYKYKFPKEIFNLQSFKKFSKLMFSRYEMFSLLDEYKTVTWIDTDVLIVGKLDNIISKALEHGMVANFESPRDKSYKHTDIVKTCFKDTFVTNKYNLKKYNMSSGFISVSDKLSERKKYTEWCYKMTTEYSLDLILPDQAILNLFIQEYNIKVEPAGEDGAYCVYPYYNRNISNAKIIHAWGSRKFWNNWYLYLKFKEWAKIYDNWLKLGGSNFLPEKIAPLISVIIPCFRPNILFMKEALDSILINQVDQHNFSFDSLEVIVVCEPVETQALENLVKEYDDRVKLVINENRAGIAKSLNIGIKLAKGKYIARMDDDDISDSKRMYLQYSYLEANPNIHLVTSNFKYFGDMNEVRYSFSKEKSHAWSIFTCPFDHPTIMFKKDFFFKNDLFYDEERSHVEDWELWLRAFDAGMIVGSIPKTLFYHRWHTGQVGQNKNTIKMMRDLVKKNFKLLNIDLTEEDLLIVPPFQGRIPEEQIHRLEKIFSLALENNKKSKKYNQEDLSYVFDLRMGEAKTGILKDIIIDEIEDDNLNISIVQKIKIKILKPLYQPFRRVYYNIMSEAVNDNLNNVKKKEEILVKTIENLNNKIINIEDNNKLLSDKLYDYNNEFQFLRYNNLNNLYFQKKIILLGTSEHNNIGDSAISLGEYLFLYKYFADFTLIELSTYEFSNKLNYLLKSINNDDLILLQGGGNLGNKYKSEENLRRTVIENFPNNKIIILPQTIYFEETDEGKKELEISQTIYNRHKNLYIFTRGKISLGYANKYFYNAKNHLMLDSALNINNNYNFDRKGILACIRDLNDESGLSKKIYNQIFEIIKSNDDNYDYTNNLHDQDISKLQRNFVVNAQLKFFAKHKLIVTDRLHGLIFALMTNTPCIVMSSYNYKLKEFTDMLKDNKYIKFIDKEIDNLDSIIKKILKEDSGDYVNDFSEYFIKMSDIIKGKK